MKKMLLVLFVLLFASCNVKESAPSKFDKEGVAFSVPAGWSVSEEESLEGGGYYLAVEKDGFDSSGLLTLTWVLGEFGDDEGVKLQQDEMRSNAIYQKADLVFQPIVKGEFSGIPSSSSKFKATVMTIPHTGTVGNFQIDGKTFMFVKQEADEDISENKAGFEAIEKSFVFGS